MVFFPARTAVASDLDVPILPYVVLASRERSPTAKPKFGLPTSQLRRFCKIGQMAVLEKGMVFPNPLPDFANFRLSEACDCMWDSIETNSGLKPELVGAEESSTDGASMVV